MKQGFIILGALALVACTTGYETDLTKAATIRQENIDARRAMNGCQFVREHDAQRNCLLATYQMNSPRTYNAQQLQDGRSVAVVSSQQSGQSGCGLKPLPTESAYEWAGPTTATQSQSVETVCQKSFEPRETVIQTVEESIAPPTPEVVFVEPEPVGVEAVTMQTGPRPVQAAWVAPVEEEVTCPCLDPNDPCPQCYDK